MLCSHIILYGALRFCRTDVPVCVFNCFRLSVPGSPSSSTFYATIFLFPKTANNGDVPIEGAHTRGRLPIGGDPSVFCLLSLRLVDSGTQFPEPIWNPHYTLRLSSRPGCFHQLGGGSRSLRVLLFLSPSLDDPSLSAAVRALEKGYCCWCCYCRCRPFAERPREKRRTTESTECVIRQQGGGRIVVVPLLVSPMCKVDSG